MKDFDKEKWAKLKPEIEMALNVEGDKHGYCFRVNRINALHGKRTFTTFKVDIFPKPL